MSCLAEYAGLRGISLNHGQAGQFEVYLKQLQVWNQSTNLTSITTDEDIVIKHFWDSIAALSIEDMKLGASLVDIGSGAGFPGLPLKLVRPDLRLTLIEPVAKKVSFLRFVVGHLRLGHVQIFAETLEKFSERSFCHSFDYATTRALKFELVLNHARRILSPSGRIILYSSKQLDPTVLGTAFSLVNATVFDLPKGKGRRAISILELAGKGC